MNEIEHAVEKYEEIRRLLSKKSFTVSNRKEINYGLQFSVEKTTWVGLVRVYQNKKGVVRVDLSQLDQSSNARAVSSIIQPTGSTDNNSANQSDSLSKNYEGRRQVQLPMIGSDESGKGDYFGPLVVACVYADNKIVKALSDVGARDSKDLSDVQIRRIAVAIRTICVNKFVVVEVMPERYNAMYADLKEEKKTLNDMLAWAHAKAIEQLLDKVDCERAVVDKFCDESVVLAKLQEKGKQLDIVQVPRAESYIAVAAASIIARDRFITRLGALGNEYGVQLPKGASRKVVSMAQKLVADNGKGVIMKVAKEHFKTTQAVFL